MTVVICEKVGGEAFIVSDAIVTRFNSQDDHMQIPLGMYINEQVPPENYHRSFVRMIQKVALIENKLAIGISGTIALATLAVRHVEKNIDNVSCIDDIRRLLLQKDGLHDSDVSVCGVLLTESGPEIFSYDYGCDEWKCGVDWVAIGSGTELAERLRGRYVKDTGAEARLKSVTALLYGREVFSSDAYFNCIGGAYSGFVCDGRSFKRPSGVTCMFWYAKVDGDRKIVAQHPPIFLNLKYSGDVAIVRSLWHKEIVGESHLEMSGIGPFALLPLISGNVCDFSDVIDVCASTFSEDDYFTGYYIEYNDIVVDFSFGFSSRDDAPFRFWGSYDDHYGAFKEDLFLDAIDVGVEIIQRNRRG